MNIGFAVAAALVDGQVLAAQFTPRNLDSDEIWRLIELTVVHLDETFDAPDGPGRCTADLAFTRRDGSVVSRRVLTPPGRLDRPLSNETLVTRSPMRSSVMRAGTASGN